MSGSTNFLQVNPNAANQETDATYSADTQRTGGMAAGSILASVLANKMFFQWSTFICALANALASKGYSPNDGSANPSTALSVLEGVLANIMTQADMSPWALLASPTFTGTPKAPTPPGTNNSTDIATTAWAQLGFSISLGSNGYIKFPEFLGSLMIQWFTLSNIVSGTYNFPTTFPNGCLFTIGADGTSGTSGACGCNPISNSQLNVKVSTQTTYAFIAIGY